MKHKYEIAKVSVATLTKDWLDKWAAKDWELFQVIPMGSKLIVIFQKDWSEEYENPLGL